MNTAESKLRVSNRHHANAHMIVLGLDKQSRPRAARFMTHDAKTIEKAAAYSGMVALKVQSAPLLKLSEKLSVGRLLPSGKAAISTIRRDQYRKLEAYLPVSLRTNASVSDGSIPPAEVATAGENQYAAAKAGGKPYSGKYPESWDKITTGQIVLASVAREDGWWTARVVDVRPDGTFLLDWEEFKGFDKFICKREQIALLHPGYDGK